MARDAQFRHQDEHRPLLQVLLSLWEERHIRSVANLTRQDGEEFLALAPRVPVRTTVRRYPLAAANTALDDLRHGRFEGAAVLDFACEAARGAGA